MLLFYHTIIPLVFPLYDLCYRFPAWPARRCSSPEEATITSWKPASSRPHMPVVFLGLGRERGWVPIAHVSPFTAESLPTSNGEFIETAKSQVNIKKVKVDRPYRFAVIEACRVLRSSEPLHQECLNALQSLEPDPIDWDREDVCTACRGTELSGDSLLCDRCNDKETHLHCLSTPSLTAPQGGDWYCQSCLKVVIQHNVPCDIT